MGWFDVLNGAVWGSAVSGTSQDLFGITYGVCQPGTGLGFFYAVGGLGAVLDLSGWHELDFERNRNQWRIPWSRLWKWLWVGSGYNGEIYTSPNGQLGQSSRSQ